jgi:hypothetical protein
MSVDLGNGGGRRWLGTEDGPLTSVDLGSGGGSLWPGTEDGPLNAGG